MKGETKLFNCKTNSESTKTIRALVSSCREKEKERVDEILIKVLNFYKINNKNNEGE